MSTGSRILQSFRQLFCDHEITVRSLSRGGDGNVSAPCLKCGKVLYGPYGLALDARFVPPPRSYKEFADA
jgi:hypothetical protein